MIHMILAMILPMILILMMRILMKFSAIFFLVLFSSALSAREVTGKIADMISWNDGHTIIKIQNGPINGCGSQYYYSLGVKGQDVKAETMLSVALAAYMGNKTVTLVTTDGSCQGGEEKITRIQLLSSP